MNKTNLVLLLIFTLSMTSCGGNAANAAQPGPAAQGEPTAGELSASTQVAIGTIKLDGTDDAVTAEQAQELLPLWQTLEVLYNRDTAADQEVDALITQIQDTMTDQQRQAITALNLTREDMMSIMQAQAMAAGGGQNVQSGGTANSNGGGFGPGGFAGGPPPDGGFPGGGQGLQNQGTRQQSTDSADTSNQPAAINPNRIPTPLVRAVIEYLKRVATPSS